MKRAAPSAALTSPQSHPQPHPQPLPLPLHLPAATRPADTTVAQCGKRPLALPPRGPALCVVELPAVKDAHRVRQFTVFASIVVHRWLTLCPRVRAVEGLTSATCNSPVLAVISESNPAHVAFVYQKPAPPVSPTLPFYGTWVECVNAVHECHADPFVTPAAEPFAAQWRYRVLGAPAMRDVEAEFVHRPGQCMTTASGRQLVMYDRTGTVFLCSIDRAPGHFQLLLRVALDTARELCARDVHAGVEACTRDGTCRLWSACDARVRPDHAAQ